MENRHKENHTIPSDILDDLASRFIINVPMKERSDIIRICFQIELAHWFYLDFYCSAEDEKLIPCGIKQFANHIFQVQISCLRIQSKTKKEDFRIYFNFLTFSAYSIFNDPHWSNQ